MDSVTISKTKAIDNSCGISGGGFSILNAQNAVLRHCLIDQNKAGAMSEGGK